MFDDLGRFARYARGLRAYLDVTLAPDECRDAMRAAVAGRGEAFVALLDHGVYRRPGSPYLRLLTHAGVELGDIANEVRRDGVEVCLTRLHDAGVHVTLDEFRGRCPVERAGLSFDVSPEDFNNPLVAGTVTSWTGGSTGAPRPMTSDFPHKTKMAVHHSLFIQSFGVADRPVGLWRSAPPGAAGLGSALGFAKAGKPIDRWFSHHAVRPRLPFARDFLYTAYTYLALRRKRRLPWPEHVPPAKADVVARWVAAQVAAGGPPLLNTTPSSCARVCLAARELDLDISGTLMRLGGEPYTPGKAKLVEEAGCRAVSNYSMSELGRVGTACADQAALDDLHLASDQVAAIALDTPSPGALWLTTVGRTAPKVMLNVESGDCAVLEVRECGCLLGELGLTTHLHDVRSYEKLTSEGMTFPGTPLVELLEQVLPARFGGDATDYQLVEDERGALVRVLLVVSPRVGEVDERALVEAVMQALRGGPAYRRMMAQAWADGEVLEVVRGEPYPSAGAKILPLQVLKP